MCGIEIDLVLASASKLTCFLCGGQNRLRFCLRAENYLVEVYGSKLDCFFFEGIGIGLGFVCEPKMTCYWCGDRLD